MDRNTSSTVFTHKRCTTLHTHICGAVHTLCLDHVHLNLSPLCTTVHLVVHVIQAALTFLEAHASLGLALSVTHSVCLVVGMFVAI